MRYYVACLHTAPGGAAAAMLPSGYACTREELETIVARAPGIPLTFESVRPRNAPLRRPTVACAALSGSRVRAII